MKKHKHLEQLVHPIKDDSGRFIPYCDFDWQQGIIATEFYHTCEARMCRHYHRLYITIGYPIISSIKHIGISNQDAKGVRNE